MPRGLSRSFQAPIDWETYYSCIKERCISLINTGIWAGIDIIQFRNWLNNFSTDEEKYFSACVLDNLIYRSPDQIESMLFQLFQRIIPDLVYKHPIPGITIDNWSESFHRSKSIDLPVRFVTVTSDEDPPTKSANFIARLLKQKLGINDSKWIIHARDIVQNKKSGIHAFFFLDDILGSGKQFDDFIISMDLENIFDSAYCAYIPLVAHKKGIQFLEKKYNIHIAAVEILDNTHSIFNPDCECFNDTINTPESAKIFLENYLIKKNICSDVNGFGNLQLIYAFSHAVPDNNIPILWYQDSKNFEPLFLR